MVPVKIYALLAAYCFALTIAPSLALAAPLAIIVDKPSPLSKELESKESGIYRAGVEAFLKADFTKAKLAFEQALKANKNYAPALVGLAAIAQAQGQVQQADQQLKNAESLAPKSPEVHLGRGRYYLWRSDPKRAEVAFRKALTLNEASVPALIELGSLYSTLPNRTTDAVASYQRAIGLDPSNLNAQYGLGVAKSIAGDRRGALNAFETAVSLSSTDPTPHRAIGRLHLEANDPKKALAAFDLALIRQPGAVDIMMDRADALGRLSAWSEARQQLQKALELAPTSAAIFVKLGDVFLGEKRYEDAQKQYLKAIELEPKNAVALNNLAWMTIERSGDLSQAVRWAKAAVNASPKSSPFYDTLAHAQRTSGNLTDALVSAKRAAELEPKIASYHDHLGVIYTAMNDPRLAASAMQRSKELSANR